MHVGWQHLCGFVSLRVCVFVLLVDVWGGSNAKTLGV